MKQQQQDTDYLAALRSYEILLRDMKAVRARLSKKPESEYWSSKSEQEQ